MRGFFLLALLLSNSSVALALEAQRANIGDSCRHAAQIETDLGKKPTYDVERMLQRNLLLFESSAETGQSEQILYRCSDSDGTVVGYSTKFTLPSKALAWSTYAHEQAAMAARLGAPPIDSETFGLPQRIRLWRAYSSVFSTNEFCQWLNTSERNVSVKIQKLRDGAQWQVITTDMPPLGGTVEEPQDRLLRVLARALVVALSSAALVAALAMTRLHPLRWLIALGVPLALSCESLWAVPWDATHSPEPLGWDFLAIAICALLGMMASSLIIWRLGSRLAPANNVPPGSSRAAKPLVCLGVVLFVALLAWLWWQFRPGNDPGDLAGGFAPKLALPPAALLVATVLTAVGTTRLPGVVPRATGQTPAADFAFAAIGVLVSVVGTTLCITIAAEIALRL